MNFLPKWLFVALCLMVGCSGTNYHPDADQQKVVVATPSTSFKIPMSGVVFSSIDVQGNNAEILFAVNRALKQSGFPLGLNMGGAIVARKTHLKMKNVTFRQLIDQMCVQLEISYWDNARLRVLDVNNGKSTAFHPNIIGDDGAYTPAGPPQFAPPGFYALPLRAAYFDRTIEDLARERHLID